MADNVNKTQVVFTNGKVECIDAIEASLSPEGFEGYLKGNVIKYIWRYELKGKKTEDLAKADWYLQKLRDQFAQDKKEFADDLAYKPPTTYILGRDGSFTRQKTSETEHTMSNGPIAAFHISKHMMDDNWKRHVIRVDVEGSKIIDRLLLASLKDDVELIYSEHLFDSVCGVSEIVYILECTDETWERLKKIYTW